MLSSLDAATLPFFLIATSFSSITTIDFSPLSLLVFLFLFYQCLIYDFIVSSIFFCKVKQAFSFSTCTSFSFSIFFFGWSDYFYFLYTTTPCLIFSIICFVLYGTYVLAGIFCHVLSQLLCLMHRIHRMDKNWLCSDTLITCEPL